MLLRLSVRHATSYPSISRVFNCRERGEQPREYLNPRNDYGVLGSCLKFRRYFVIKSKQRRVLLVLTCNSIGLPNDS